MVSNISKIHTFVVKEPFSLICFKLFYKESDKLFFNFHRKPCMSSLQLQINGKEKQKLTYLFPTEPKSQFYHIRFLIMDIFLK